MRLTIASPLGDGARGNAMSLGWGLRGIRERVELTGGTFSAGRENGRWTLSATLPVPVPGPLEPGDQAQEERWLAAR